MATRIIEGSDRPFETFTDGWIEQHSLPNKITRIFMNGVEIKNLGLSDVSITEFVLDGVKYTRGSIKYAWSNNVIYNVTMEYNTLTYTATDTPHYPNNENIIDSIDGDTVLINGDLIHNIDENVWIDDIPNNKVDVYIGGKLVHTYPAHGETELQYGNTKYIRDTYIGTDGTLVLYSYYIQELPLNSNKIDIPSSWKELGINNTERMKSLAILQNTVLNEKKRELAELCDENLDYTVINQILLNNDFTSGGTDWTNNGWGFASNSAISSGTTGEGISQFVTAEANTVYTIILDISTYTSGTLEIYSNGILFGKTSKEGKVNFQIETDNVGVIPLALICGEDPFIGVLNKVELSSDISYNSITDLDGRIDTLDTEMSKLISGLGATSQEIIDLKNALDSSPSGSTVYLSTEQGRSLDSDDFHRSIVTMSNLFERYETNHIVLSVNYARWEESLGMSYGLQYYEPALKDLFGDNNNLGQEFLESDESLIYIRSTFNVNVNLIDRQFIMNRDGDNRILPYSLNRETGLLELIYDGTHVFPLDSVAFGLTGILHSDFGYLGVRNGLISLTEDRPLLRDGYYYGRYRITIHKDALDFYKFHGNSLLDDLDEHKDITFPQFLRTSLGNLQFYYQGFARALVYPKVYIPANDFDDGNKMRKGAFKYMTHEQFFETIADFHFYESDTPNIAKIFLSAIININKYMFIKFFASLNQYLDAVTLNWIFEPISRELLRTIKRERERLKRVGEGNSTYSTALEVSEFIVGTLIGSGQATATKSLYDLTTLMSGNSINLSVPVTASVILSKLFEIAVFTEIEVLERNINGEDVSFIDVLLEQFNGNLDGYDDSDVPNTLDIKEEEKHDNLIMTVRQQQLLDRYSHSTSYEPLDQIAGSIEGGKQNYDLLGKLK